MNRGVIGSRRANIAHPLRRRKPGLWMQNDCTDQVALCVPVAGRRDRVGAVAHDLTLVRSVVADLFAAGFAVTVAVGPRNCTASPRRGNTATST